MLREAPVARILGGAGHELPRRGDDGDHVVVRALLADLPQLSGAVELRDPGELGRDRGGEGGAGTAHPPARHAPGAQQIGAALVHEHVHHVLSLEAAAGDQHRAGPLRLQGEGLLADLVDRGGQRPAQQLRRLGHGRAEHIGQGHQLGGERGRALGGDQGCAVRADHHRVQHDRAQLTAVRPDGRRDLRDRRRAAERTDLRGVHSQIPRDRLDLAAHHARGQRMGALDPCRGDHGDHADHARPVGAERREGLEIRLQAGGPVGLRSGDGQDEGRAHAVSISRWSRHRRGAGWRSGTAHRFRERRVPTAPGISILIPGMRCSACENRPGAGASPAPRGDGTAVPGRWR